MASSYGDPRALVCECVRTVLLPPPDMTGSEWAEAFRVLSREDSSAPGRWSNDSRPYQTEILDVACDLAHEFVDVLGPSQFGKTQLGLNFIGDHVHLDPGPMLAVFPTISMAERWSKTRLSPMIRDCEVLSGLFAPDKSRDKSATILEKTFPGGLLIGVGANAPGGLASQPIRYLYLEETDRVPIDDSAGEEGDYEVLAIARTKDFRGKRKIYRVTSPTVEGRSRGARNYAKSDQRRWYFKCPHCGHEQRPFWENVAFDKDNPNPDETTYGCSGCGVALSQAELSKALRNGRWIAERPEVQGHAGFWIHGLQVLPMAQILKEYLEAKSRGMEALQAWKNTCLGELWNPKFGEEAQVEGILARAKAETYLSGQVPDGVGILTASVDVQTSPQRLELLVWGTGSGEEAWWIQHVEIPGNLAQNEPWDRLEALLLQDWGGQKIRLAVPDTGGHFTSQVYRFAKRPRLRGLVQPSKGGTLPQRRLVRRSNSRNRLWLIDTVAAKDQVYSRLTVPEPGPGYIHFPADLDPRHVDQILSERVKSKGGRRGYEKISPDAPNEALDLICMNLAAIEIFAPRDLEALVRRRAAPAPATATPEPQEELPVEDETPAPAPAREIRRIRAPRRGGGGGMTGFGGAW